MKYRGNDNQKIHPLHRIIIGLIFLIIFIALIITINMDNGYKIRTKPSTKTVYLIAQNWVEKRLKLPSNAVFPNNKYEEHTFRLSNNKYKVDSYLEIVEPSGAKLRIEFTVIVQYRGEKNWRLISLETD